ncbi:MAG: diacylglycerol/lipid kinase family protein [Myxococcaceae bacterium]
MKTFLVVNPQSAGGATGKKWPELSAEIGKAVGDFGHAFTSGPMEAMSLARKAIHEGYECIVAVGGDGTINEVTNGFFESGKAINPNAALAVLSRGTGGDFRRTFGWDLELKSALSRLRTPETQPFDVGVIEFTDHSGKSATRYFANIASFGVSGQVDHEVNKGSKALGGKLSFMMGSLKALMKYSDKKVRIRADDKSQEEVTVTTIAVANGRYFGGGMCVAPEADTKDGILDVTIWTGYGLGDFVFKQKALYSGTHTKLPGTRTLRCKTFVAEADEQVLIDVDGEQPGRLPCRVSLLPGAIRLKV